MKPPTPTGHPRPRRRRHSGSDRRPAGSASDRFKRRVDRLRRMENDARVERIAWGDEPFGGLAA